MNPGHVFLTSTRSGLKPKPEEEKIWFKGKMGKAVKKRQRWEKRMRGADGYTGRRPGAPVRDRCRLQAQHLRRPPPRPVT